MNANPNLIKKYKSHRYFFDNCMDKHLNGNDHIL